MMSPRLIKCPVTVGLAVLLSGAPAALRADVSPSACRFEFGAGAVAAPGGAVRICSLPGQPAGEMRFVLSPPVRGEIGICRFTQRRIFGEAGGWTYDPPAGQSHLGGVAVFMMAGEGACGRQDDARYIVTNGISEGMFAAALRLWEGLRSGERLEAAMAGLPASRRSAAAARRFERAIRDRRGNAPPVRLMNVSLFDPSPERVAAHYALDVRGSPDSWVLIADFVGDELRLLDVGELHY